ncbi:MAG TPA: helicase-related protein, partial [Phycisphaerales bacterium]|nr:helicase-related protein [Phycisphaerales bacterium]
SMNRAHDYFDSLERFRSGDARVIVGTQMVAKGLDFPGVELVGVINADTALALPDFRSTERTFQLVSQVAGRAGRAEASGRVARVIVQTFNPHEPAIRLAADHDYKAFAARELDLRAAAGLPPAWRMARIVCRDKNPGKAEQRAEDIARALHAVAGNDEGASSPSRPPSMRLRGPMPCPISRIAGYYRYAVEMLAPSAGPIQRALTKLRADGLVKSDAHTAVDVDPTALL